VRQHRSTIIFVNSRRLAERLAAAINELAGEDLVRAHHGSIAKEQRLLIEDALKAGRLPGLVATSSLELGIDMGAVDLVMEEWSVAALSELVHRAYPFSDLGPRALESTLDMLSGRYPSDEFAELRPRIVWDRLEGTIRGRAGAQRLAVVSGGTIPDRGLFS